MALKAIDRNTLPVRSAGQTSIPQDEQAQLLELVTSGQSASDGKAYETSKEAVKAGGPYKRFLTAQVRAGHVEGAVRMRTFPAGKDGKQFGWAVFTD